VADQFFGFVDKEITMTQLQISYVAPASEETFQRVAEKIRERNIDVIAVDNGDEARKLVLEMVPEGAEVFSGKSKTLQDIGVFEVIHQSGKYDALRNRYLKMDRATQGREIRKLVGAPDYVLGSVNAVTEDGVLVATSATASQIGPYANTAGKVILVVGSQKIVPDLETALQRIREYVLPWEDEQVRQRLPSGSFIGKTLITEREWMKGRTTVILVRQAIGM
jgi:hypothetical protein